MPLKTIDPNATKRYTDGAAFLVLLTSTSKAVEDTIQDLNSNYRIPAGAFAGDGVAASVEVVTNARQINRTLFELLAVEWSLGMDPDAAAYDKLDSESGRWVDDCIADAISIGRGRVEGESPSSKRPKGSRGTSARARASRSTPSPEPSDD